jgi:hypothetical protein
MTMSDKHRKTMLIIGILGLLGLAATALFFLTHEKVEKEVREAPSGEAKHNHFLALERLLTRFQQGAETVRKLSEPDDSHTTIVLADPSYDFSPEQVDAWEKWVGGGGHLVLAQPMGEANEKTAPLLTKLGFSPEPESSWPENVDGVAVELSNELGASSELIWVAADVDWLARTPSRDPGADPADSADSDDEQVSVEDTGGEAVVAASRPHETGRVTLVGDTSIFDNQRIGKAEHAVLAVRIADLSPYYSTEHPSVTIVLFGKRQSWMFYVLTYTWPFVAIVLVALLLAIRAGRNRFGPMLADPAPERRSRREHIDAVGRFLWQQGSVASLVEAAQKALLDELEDRHPALGHVGLADRDEIIAEELDISQHEARNLFRKPSGNRNAQSFTEQIRTLELHRRSL